MSGLLLGLIGGGVSGLATTLGGAPILIKDSKIGKILKNINMDFVTGLMLSAAAFSLIWPAYERVYFSAERSFQLLIVSFALVGGVIFIKSVGKFLEYLLRHNENARENKKAMLFVIAMMVHNFPEGLASGASMTLPGSQGVSLLSAIAMQNVPEGFTTALSFITLGVNPVMAFFGNMLTGVVELVGGIIGGYMSSQIDGVLPILMAFAGGAMMSVVLGELADKLKEGSYRFLMKPSFLSGMALVIIFNNL
ncbi:ZIP family zinc transporter [Bacteriovorax stolpii]|nr:ZIP family metal transporter [Bacteriovorax stolpii]TDP53480.1 ZIP family zinc transporter [Bacteriovorax stolpii]